MTSLYNYHSHYSIAQQMC